MGRLDERVRGMGRSRRKSEDDFSYGMILRFLLGWMVWLVDTLFALVASVSWLP